jgi:hypothetical protein
VNTRITEVSWDCTVALAYIAEQLFAAAQLLTSDILASEIALRTACENHISALLEYQRFLPSIIVQRLDSVQKTCVEAEGREISRTDAQQLAAQVMQIVREISTHLNAIETRRSAA